MLLKAIEELGFAHPTPIQERAIPKILEGCDLRASAQTGTGKTAAFFLPALQRVLESPTAGRGPRILVLVPTRELAMQVAKEADKFTKYLPRVKTACIYGGVPYPVQNRMLSRPYDILVATPGRLIDQLQRRRINLSRVEMLILDEADRMLDMGFIEPVEEIAAATPKNRQTLLFSATMKGAVLNLSKRLLRDPVEIAVAADPLRASGVIEQRLHYVDNLQHKQRLLDHLLNDPTLHHAIVFTATKSYADELVDRLYEQGYQAGALHGDMNQRQRTRTLNQLRQGRIRILVATDVAARGIDISTVSHVINFDLPRNAEDYVHRIGRTGRAGASGVALSFATPKERGLVATIERFTGQTISPHTIPGMEPQSRFETGRKRPFKRSFQPRQNRSTRSSFPPKKRGKREYQWRSLSKQESGQRRPKPF